MKNKPRINRYEGIKSGIDRIAQAIASDAHGLCANEQSADKAVHQMRLSCKRMRALLKLLAPAEGYELCMAEDKKVRDVARKLSELRDSDVVRQTIQKLTFEEKTKELKAFFSLLGSETKKAGGERNEGLNILLAECATTLGGAADLIEKVTPEAKGWPLLVAGLKESYKAARRQFLKTKANEGVDAFHDMRKRCKDLLYQLEFVSALWPDNLKNLRKLLAKVAGQLGASNDLAVAAAEMPKLVGEESGKELVRDAERYLMKRRKGAAAKALGMAESVFKLSHRDWVAQMKAKRWRPAPVAVRDAVAGKSRNVKRAKAEAEIGTKKQGKAKRKQLTA